MRREKGFWTRRGGRRLEMMKLIWIGLIIFDLLGFLVLIYRWGEWSGHKAGYLEGYEYGKKKSGGKTAGRLMDALKKIRTTQGKVCSSYEICTHEACASSYNSWAIADEALTAEKDLRRE